LEEGTGAWARFGLWRDRPSRQGLGALLDGDTESGIIHPVLGTIVKEARTRARISQRELAIRSRTSQSAISRIEAGLEEPSFDRFAQIMAVMGWKPKLSLEPVAEHDADTARLIEQQGMSPQERLDSGLAWIEFSRDVLGAANRG